MLKKIYIAPKCEEVEIDVENSLCSSENPDSLGIVIDGEQVS